MKDLTIHINVMVEENNLNGPRHEIFEETVYLAVSPEVALDDATRQYLVATTKSLVQSALAQIQKEYRPDLEVTS